MASELGLRQAYQTIKNAYKMKQRNPVTTASDLKSIVPIVANKTVYDFPIIVGDDNNNYPDAILLNRADAFTAVEIGVFIGKRLGNGVSVQVPYTSFDWFSYPNPNEFSTDSTSLKTLFNGGILNATINNVQYLQNWSLLRTRRAPISQQAYSTAGSTAGTAVDSFNGEQDGFYNLVPTLNLSGTSKISIQISLPSSLPALTSTTGQYCLMVAMRGFLSLGASNLNK